MEFWNVTPCSLIDKYHRFGGTCCLPLQRKRMKNTLNMEASFPSETLVPIDQTTWNHTPEDRNLNHIIWETYI
jgi:hypothetical protein